ncbi:small ribosomal subunit protein uS9c [Lycium barbarum]|uniref:small ribosomal subunit protein uS9c n=1 Tax=Lycium barbarum TaxID=112863 RepID=UPI00293E29C3|nr:small ribosomal subunit protein uS9c [Lycium barbarum]
MAISMASLTSSFASLSFSSQISQKPFTLSLTHSKQQLSLSSKIPSLVVSASVAEAPEELETREDLLKLVKSRLPGGFAAQPIHGTGRRKSASARVVLQEGSGKIIINYRDAKEYLQGNPLWIQYVKTPLATLGYEASYDIFVKVEGGGLSGQAQAISLGIARALLKVSESHRKPLRGEGLLTRDARVVERKKVGLKKARKRPQFSKR